MLQLEDELREDEYILQFDKNKLDEMFGYVCPENPHHVVGVGLLVSTAPSRRTLKATCACGSTATPSGYGEQTTYAQMLALALLDGACPNTAFRDAGRHVATAPDDCSSLTG